MISSNNLLEIVSIEKIGPDYYLLYVGYRGQSHQISLILLEDPEFPFFYQTFEERFQIKRAKERHILEKLSEFASRLGSGEELELPFALGEKSEEVSPESLSLPLTQFEVIDSLAEATQLSKKAITRVFQVLSKEVFEDEDKSLVVPYFGRIEFIVLAESEVKNPENGETIKRKSRTERKFTPPGREENLGEFLRPERNSLLRKIYSASGLPTEETLFLFRELRKIIFSDKLPIDGVQFPGLGRFRVRKLSARVVRDPDTKEPVNKSSETKVSFHFFSPVVSKYFVLDKVVSSKACLSPIIQRAQRELGFEFSPDYIEFIESGYDLGEMPMDALRIDDPGSSLNIQKVREVATKSYGLPEDLLPIVEVNSDYYCLAESGEVRFWSHNGIADEKWKSISAWREAMYEEFFSGYKPELLADPVESFLGWLKENAPTLASTFSEPVKEEVISRAESRIGFALPESFKKLYLIHNGQSKTACSGPFYGLSFMSFGEVLEAWLEISALVFDGTAESMESGNFYTSHIPGVVRPLYFSDMWLPFAHDDSGNYLALDFSPGVLGSTGQVINCGPEEGKKFAIAENFDMFLSWLVGQWRLGNFIINQEEGSEFLSTLYPPCSSFLDSIKVLCR